MVDKWTAAQMPSQAGKTILVTGANSGIGYQAALELARHGGRVLLGCRDAAKGEAAAANIRKAVGNAQDENVTLDMASLASIRAFAASFAARGLALDTLINNAGVMALAKREVTADGFERQFGTNHLGHFALTGLLLPALKQSSVARVVTVASLAHRSGRMTWDDLQSEKKYVPWDAYNTSKLANILFARELDRRARTEGLALLSVPVHPGVSRTKIFENGPGTSNLKARVVKLLGFALTQDDAMGALPTEYAATAPGVEGGAYIGPSGFGELKGYPKAVEPRPQAMDREAGERLWKISEQLTGLSYL